MIYLGARGAPMRTYTQNHDSDQTCLALLPPSSRVSLKLKIRAHKIVLAIQVHSSEIYFKDYDFLRRSKAAEKE